MNNERLDYLLRYMDGLARLNSGGYRCSSEIDECVGWVRKELLKEPENKTTVTYNGEVISHD